MPSASTHPQDLVVGLGRQHARDLGGVRRRSCSLWCRRLRCRCFRCILERLQGCTESLTPCPGSDDDGFLSRCLCRPCLLDFLKHPPYATLLLNPWNRPPHLGKASLQPLPPLLVLRSLHLRSPGGCGTAPALSEFVESQKRQSPWRSQPPAAAAAARSAQPPLAQPWRPPPPLLPLQPATQQREVLQAGPCSDSWVHISEAFMHADVAWRPPPLTFDVCRQQTEKTPGVLAHFGQEVLQALPAAAAAWSY